MLNHSSLLADSTRPPPLHASASFQLSCHQRALSGANVLARAPKPPPRDIDDKENATNGSIPRRGGAPELPSSAPINHGSSHIFSSGRRQGKSVSAGNALAARASPATPSVSKHHHDQSFEKAHDARREVTGIKSDRAPLGGGGKNDTLKRYSTMISPTTCREQEACLLTPSINRVDDAVPSDAASRAGCTAEQERSDQTSIRGDANSSIKPRSVRKNSFETPRVNHPAESDQAQSELLTPGSAVTPYLDGNFAKRQAHLIKMLERDKFSNPESWLAYLQFEYARQTQPEKLISKINQFVFTRVDSASYSDDLNYLKIWLLYAHLHSSAQDRHDIYKKMQVDGIGKRLASFYISWARFEVHHCGLDRVQSIFSLALEHDAQPSQAIETCQAELLPTHRLSSSAVLPAVMSEVATETTSSSDNRNVCLTSPRALKRSPDLLFGALSTKIPSALSSSPSLVSRKSPPLDSSTWSQFVAPCVQTSDHAILPQRSTPQATGICNGSQVKHAGTSAQRQSTLKSLGSSFRGGAKRQIVTEKNSSSIDSTRLSPPESVDFDKARVCQTSGQSIPDRTCPTELGDRRGGDDRDDERDASLGSQLDRTRTRRIADVDESGLVDHAAKRRCSESEDRPSVALQDGVKHDAKSVPWPRSGRNASRESVVDHHLERFPSLDSSLHADRPCSTSPPIPLPLEANISEYKLAEAKNPDPTFQNFEAKNPDVKFNIQNFETKNPDVKFNIQNFEAKNPDPKFNIQNFEAKNPDPKSNIQHPELKSMEPRSNIQQAGPDCMEPNSNVQKLESKNSKLKIQNPESKSNAKSLDTSLFDAGPAAVRRSPRPSTEASNPPHPKAVAADALAQRVSSEHREHWQQAASLLKTSVIELKSVPYLNLGLIGKGGSSRVYRVLSPDFTILALKVVSLADQPPEILEQYLNEVKLLHSLRGKNRYVIELADAAVNYEKQALMVLLEYAEIDLHRLLTNDSAVKQHLARAAQIGEPVLHGRLANDIEALRYYWKSMLMAVQIIHNHRIVHGDLKPANFVIVKGQLKLIDFGIAKAISHNTSNIRREDIVGTLNYIAPEAVSPRENSQWKISLASDVWSLGCILYQMVYGYAPFERVKNFTKKLIAISGGDGSTIEFPPISNGHLVQIMESCLQRDPAARPTISDLLLHEFFDQRLRPL